jgi:hypothetical protein
MSKKINSNKIIGFLIILIMVFLFCLNLSYKINDFDKIYEKDDGNYSKIEIKKINQKLEDSKLGCEFILETFQEMTINETLENNNITNYEYDNIKKDYLNYFLTGSISNSNHYDIFCKINVTITQHLSKDIKKYNITITKNKNKHFDLPIFLPSGDSKIDFTYDCNPLLK